MNKLAAVIKQHRNSLGLNQLELAERSGIPSGTIASIESGYSKNPAYDVIVKLADVFEISIDALLKELQDFKLTPDDERVQRIVDSGRYEPFKTNLKGISPALKQVAEVEENRLSTEINRLQEKIAVFQAQVAALEILKEGYSELQCDIANKEGYGGKAA